MPLLLRPGSILAVGTEYERPDYDFCDNVKFLLYLPEDSMKAETEVTDIHGNIVMHVFAEREESCIKVQTDGARADYRIEVLGEDLEIRWI